MDAEVGIEPTFVLSKSTVLPLNDSAMVAGGGFAPHRPPGYEPGELLLLYPATKNGGVFSGFNMSSNLSNMVAIVGIEPTQTRL